MTHTLHGVSAMLGPSQPRYKCTVHGSFPNYIYLCLSSHTWCASYRSTPESPGMPLGVESFCLATPSVESLCLATPTSGHTASRVGLRESASA
eukprot:scaffold42707_cov60-Phaeocystis_antarctica.AAC.4